MTEQRNDRRRALSLQ